MEHGLVRFLFPSAESAATDRIPCLPMESARTTTLLVSLVQTRRIPYPLMRDGGPGARAADAARDISRSVHHLFQSPSAPHLRQSVPAGAAERQRPEIDAADAWPAERSRLVSGPAAL